MASSPDIVAKVWSLCDILRDDGITYHQYVNELSYLIGERGDNLDIIWRNDDESTSGHELAEPEEIASLIRERLTTALEQIDSLVGILEGDHTELENDS